jgi:hypothetical protein
MVLQQKNNIVTEKAYQLALSSQYTNMAQMNHSLYLDIIQNTYEI